MNILMSIVQSTQIFVHFGIYAVLLYGRVDVVAIKTNIK